MENQDKKPTPYVAPLQPEPDLKAKEIEQYYKEIINPYCYSSWRTMAKSYVERLLSDMGDVLEGYDYRMTVQTRWHEHKSYWEAVLACIDDIY